MSGNWYVRQFGDRARFAILISLGRDPHPTGSEAIDKTWGSLAIWVRNRCLTRSIRDDGTMADEVQWNLYDILRWLVDCSVRLVNEEPFPDPARLDHVQDACDWYNDTEAPPFTLTETEEDDWFLRRSEWRRYHALRPAAIDAALPHIMIRRLGDFLEVSWDNETWRPSRPDLRFVEQRGIEFVGARQAALDLQDALSDVTRKLANESQLPELVDLNVNAAAMVADDSDWQWLIHRQTAGIICGELPHLADLLRKHTQKQHVGIYVPHTPETLILRQAKLTSAKDVMALLNAAESFPEEAVTPAIRGLIRPSNASTTRPYLEGYERARVVRDALGWGDDPAPNLGTWMQSNNIAVQWRELPAAVDLLATRADNEYATAILNPRIGSRYRKEIAEATALGHLLFDEIPVAVDGTWEHWPTAARARAFAAMLMLPDTGIRAMLGHHGTIDTDTIRRIMDHFRTGAYATTYHLCNLKLMTDERRVDILRELAA